MFHNRKLNNHINRIHESALRNVYQDRKHNVSYEVFDITESSYPLRNELRFKSPNIRTVRYGIATATFVGSRIWSYMHSELKQSTSLNEFSSKIKTWKPENYPCKLSKI